MKIQSVSYDFSKLNSFSSTKKTNKLNSINTAGLKESDIGMNGDKFVMEGSASKYFELEKNLSNPKVGSKFLIRPKHSQYSDLSLLITPESSIKSDDMYVGIIKKDDNTPSFKGRLYGSIREDEDKTDYRMMSEYIRFWQDGMYSKVNEKYLDKEYAPKLKDDYNFFIPSDGDGTRYRDITSLQGGVTKPASYIPASLNEKNMSLVQGVITNFTKTGKLDKMYDFVKVKPAQGSAYAFLEGLKNNQISTKHPIVFSWGDNFTDVNVSKLLYEHEQNDSLFTITAIPVDKNETKSLSVVKINSLDDKKVEDFVEKPQDDEFIESCVISELHGEKCLAAVGPYIISPQVLEWIKYNYTENPESFKNPDKGYDFSSMIIVPVLEAINNGDITNDKEQSSGDMRLSIISEDETWSDLGSQKDFSIAMNQIVNGKYSNMPAEMITSVKKNVDSKGNITFNNTSRKLFNSMISELNLDAENVIAYCND